MATLIDSYAGANADSGYIAGADTSYFGQSFAIGSTSNNRITQVSFAAKKVGSPTGTMYCEIYTHSGTFGTNSVPTGSPLITSVGQDIADLNTVVAWIDSLFDNIPPICLDGSTNYCAVFKIAYTFRDASNYAVVYFDASSPTHNGNFSYYNGSWVAESGKDAVFYVYGDIAVTASPGTMADDSAVGTQAWSDVDNAKTNNTVYATAGSSGSTTHYLKATNFGFSIPAGATVGGIFVEVKRYSPGMGRSSDSVAKIVKGGTVGATDKSIVGYWDGEDTGVYFRYGASDDLWSETWSASDINSTDFGFVLSATVGAQTPSVDHIRITVYYTPTNSITGPFPTSRLDLL